MRLGNSMVRNACMLKSRAQRLQRATGGDLHLYVRHLISLACQANDRSGQMCPQLERYHSPRWPWKHFTRSTLAPGVWKYTNTHCTHTLTLIITYTAQLGTLWPPLCSEKHTQPSFCLSGPAVATFATGYRCSWCQLTNHRRAGCCRSGSPAFCFSALFFISLLMCFKDADASVCVELRWMLWTLDPTGVCLEPALRVDLVLLFCFLQGRFVLCVYIVCAF